MCNNINLTFAQNSIKLFSKERLHNELLNATNMNAVELRAWLRTDIAPITVANYKDAPSLDLSNKLLRILMKTTEELNRTDCLIIQSVLQRIKYLKANRSRDSFLRLDWENSLRNLGYDLKKSATKAKETKAVY